MARRRATSDDARRARCVQHGAGASGLAEYIRRFPEDTFVRDAAIKAGRWLIACMGDKPWFEGGVSAKAEHGNLSYNSMVSWGLAELGEAVGNPALTHAAHVSATHYASQVDERNGSTKPASPMPTALFL